jgi:nicotinamidase-related amidase
MTKAQAVDRQNCCGILIDVQDFFLAQVGKRRQAELKVNTANFVRLLNYFKLPLVVTMEKPVERKGLVPKKISNIFEDGAARFEKEFFDLTKEDEIRDYLVGLNRKQVLIAGCETDVCVLQSCLGLIRLGFDVFLVEELLFSSAPRVEAAVARMQQEGAILLSYKTLYYELSQAVEGGRHRSEMELQFGPLPDNLPDFSVE